MSQSSRFGANYEPVSPVDVVDKSRRPSGGNYLEPEGQKPTRPAPRSLRTSSSSSSLSLKPPRIARFAEATSVNSPVTGPQEVTQSPFADPPAMAENEPRPSDVGFGYISNEPVEQHATIRSHTNGPASPLKSALKTPGTPGRMLNPMTPTFREEQMLEKSEEHTEKQQAKDLKIKTRVRMAKMVLRGVNFSCSLIVLSMLSTSFSIFNATKVLPPRNNLPVWATGTKTWPQIVVLVISCVSLAFSILIFWAYYRGGHKRAEKTAVYYTVFAVGFFIFSIIMWAIGAGILHGSKANGNGMDMWGWSCKDNKRRQLFENDVQYALVCRLQNWSLICCIIEIVVETITIAIYAVVFYRFYSKNRLRKSMDVRDRARSDLYLAQLRSQSAPNTPGFAQSPRAPGFPAMARSEQVANDYAYYSSMERSEQQNANVQYASASSGPAEGSPNTSQPFKLQAPPIRIHNATPQPSQDGFEPVRIVSPVTPPSAERTNEHMAAAPGEKQYDAVPIPGAYSGALANRAVSPQHGQAEHGYDYRSGQAF